MTSKFASLHANLLARKGEAAPVFSDPAVSYVAAPRPLQASDAAEVRRDVASADGLPLIAEKMMMDPHGDDEAIGQLTREMNRTATRASAETRSPPRLRAVGSPAPRDADGEHYGPYRFTFRMSPDQRRRLRIVTAREELVPAAIALRGARQLSRRPVRLFAEGLRLPGAARRRSPELVQHGHDAASGCRQ